jgi:hypothetical protein
MDRRTSIRESFTLTAAPWLQKDLSAMDRNALGYLTDLNRNMEGALAQLERLAEYPELNHEDFVIYQTYLLEYLADANLLVLDALEEFEHETMLNANRGRVAYEKNIRDPDDCYFDVRTREEELRAQGLPSKIGVLRGMRRTTAQDILSDSFGNEAESATEPNPAEDQTAAEERRS